MESGLAEIAFDLVMAPRNGDGGLGHRRVPDNYVLDGIFSYVQLWHLGRVDGMHSCQWSKLEIPSVASPRRLNLRLKYVGTRPSEVAGRWLSSL